MNLAETANGLGSNVKTLHLKAGCVLIMAIWKQKPAEGVLWYKDRGSESLGIC